MADSSFLERTVGRAPEVDGSPAESAGRCADVNQNGPHGAAIAWLADRGITRGCDQARFCPDRPVTRGQMAAFLSRVFGNGAVVDGGAAFTDVPASSPFPTGISWLSSTGVRTMGVRDALESTQRQCCQLSVVGDRSADS